MTKIHTEALAAWDSADEVARRAVLDHALARARRAFDKEESSGQCSAWIPPSIDTIEVIEAQMAPHLIATLVTTHRVYHYAQSGSDWSIQTVAITETSYDGTVSERVLCEREIDISEHHGDDHDDAASVVEVIAKWRADIARAVEHVRQRAAAAMSGYSGGWPITFEGGIVVDVIEVNHDAGWLLVTTSARFRIDLGAQSGSDYSKRVVLIEETKVSFTIETRTLFEREDQRGEYEDFDTAAFAREVVEDWRRRRAVT